MEMEELELEMVAEEEVEDPVILEVFGELPTT